MSVTIHRKAVHMLLAALLLASLVMVGAIVRPASASTATPKATAPAVAACTTHVDIGLTVKSGSYIKGSASYTKCNIELQSVLVQLNRVQGAFGVPKKTWFRNPAPYGAHSIGLSYYCGGSGTYTYYTTITTYLPPGIPGASIVTNYKRSNYLRVRC
jgi:hypothetical protein